MLPVQSKDMGLRHYLLPNLPKTFTAILVKAQKRIMSNNHKRKLAQSRVGY